MDCSLALKRACKRSKIQVYEILASEYAIQFEDDNSETELSI